MSIPDKKNPVQIVLNASNYIDYQEKSAGGGNRDFFFNRDDEFAQHRVKINTQLEAIQNVLESSRAGGTAFVKVKLRQEAWAKSHRPTQKVFPPNLFPSAGGDGIAETYYKISSKTIPKLLRTISEAEPESRSKFNEKKQKVEPKPSRVRSELGAIQEVILPTESDRRSFSAKEAVDWLKDGRSGKIYLIDLFKLPNTLADFGKMSLDEQKLLGSLIESLNSLDFGIIVFRSAIASPKGHHYLLVRPVKEKAPLSIRNFFESWNPSFAEFQYDDSETHHDQLLKIFSKHPLIRRIALPPIIQSAQHTGSLANTKAQFPQKKEGTRYPKIGVIDSGVRSDFADWILGSSGVIDPSHRREDHGSFIAGLLIAARSAGNSEEVAREFDGCDVIDLDIFPNHQALGAFEEYYPNGFEDFLAEMDLAIAIAKQRHGVRIFNLSLNLEQQVNEAIYSPFAALLDSIAEKHDIIIVISAGNLKEDKFRGVWPSDPGKVASHLLPHAGSDRIFQPAESVYSISVGAINPPEALGHIAGAPSPYTRCGPGMKVGVKPDFCHYGGTTRLERENEALFSLSGDGEILSGMGTSYAAPLVAKTLASIESRIEGYVPRENLIALMVHRAKVPEVLDHAELSTIARNFVGFGLPSSSEDCLLNGDESVTMLFNSTLTPGKELRFDFAWPQALVSEGGKCRGEARMTLVYKPIIDASCGAEFIRVNLDARLRQNNGTGHYKGHAHQLFMKGTSDDAHFEADLIEHGLKWWPVKHYRMSAPEGIGKSSQWRLVVTPLLRDGATFPSEGVPFTVILTVSDPTEKKPIFNEMRQWLTAHNVSCDDIRTAARVRARR